MPAHLNDGRELMNYDVAGTKRVAKHRENKMVGNRLDSI
jgi:hypothetical protein